MLEVGTPAPDFTLPDGEGNAVTLSEFRGRTVVLYFYPKDLTPACTQQACDLRDRYAELQATGAVLLGVSADSSKRHRNFAAKHDLPFPLLADTETTVSTLYGVWKEKAMYGRTFMGIERTTFLIGPDGIIQRLWPKVKVAGHADEVLAALKG